MRIRPDIKKPQAEIDCQRSGGNEQPFSCWRVRAPQRSAHRITKRGHGEARIQSGATGADGELMTGQEKGAIRDLVAQVAEGCVDGEWRRIVTACQSYGRACDEAQNDQREGGQE